MCYNGPAGYRHLYIVRDYPLTLNLTLKRSNEVAGHTDTQPPDDNLAYAPADCLNTSSPDQLQLISYDYLKAMRSWLLKDHHSAPLVRLHNRYPNVKLIVFIEVCQCDNILQLPYVLKYEGNKARWKRTEFYRSFKRTSSDIVHFAATSPGERAMYFPSIGAVFTKAFYNISPTEALSLKVIAERLRKNVHKIIPAHQSQGSSQQTPKVYCSRKINDPHFFAALGFCPLNPGVNIDSIPPTSSQPHDTWREVVDSFFLLFHLLFELLVEMGLCNVMLWIMGGT
ncbi:unnamed protein product [Rhizoctonia solani]|uniref:Uncharacterized protein n=1 Tax=Rhizoctonia solani TaxID=456999 RepID=A0A8H3DKF3_9AGAM|nr:unnamed protein product [Rhizoctonia solani]